MTIKDNSPEAFLARKFKDAKEAEGGRALSPRPLSIASTDEEISIQSEAFLAKRFKDEGAAERTGLLAQRASSASADEEISIQSETFLAKKFEDAGAAERTGLLAQRASSASSDAEASAKNALVCVSGGLDSISLLHIFRNSPNIIVAHFNHGTRPSADDDELFVRHLAEDIYHLPFYSHKRFLGENTSENLARLSRYDFLKSLAKKHNAIIYTAHHADDLLESIAINLLRGTSYHGLLPFGDSEVNHPFLTPTLLPETSELSNLPIIKKSDLYKYAAKNHLTFREDPTNHEDKYLRNRLRQNLQFLSSEKKQKLLNLYKNTLLLDKEIHKNLPLAKTFSRDFFREIPEIVALEILRENLKQYNLSLTRPQLKDLLSAIKTYSPEKSFNLPGNRLLKLHKSTFTLDIFQ